MLTPKTSASRLVLPRAASGDEPANADAGTLSFDDALEKVRLKKAAGWVDLATGGGAGVSSFNSRTGAVTPQSGDYTATLVGLGNVTNDAQLKRSANDYSSFATKSAPDAADVLVVEDSAASGAKKSITVASIPFGQAGSVPIYVPPITANATDMEFDSTTIPAALKFWDRAGSTFRSPAQATSVYSTGPATGNVWADAHTTNSGRRSWLRVQIPSSGGNQYLIGQSVTVPTDVVYWTRVMYGVGTGSPSSPNEYLQLAIWANDSGHPDENNRIAVGFGPGNIQVNHILGGASQTGTGTNSITLINPLPEYFGIEKRTSGGTATYICWLAGPDGNNAIPLAAFTSTLVGAWVGWEMRGGSGVVGTVSPNLYLADFIRQASKLPWQ